MPVVMARSQSAPLCPTHTLFAVGSRADVPVACVLAVSDTFDAHGARTHIDEHTLPAAAESMGAVAVTALGEAKT